VSHESFDEVVTGYPPARMAWCSGVTIGLVHRPHTHARACGQPRRTIRTTPRCIARQSRDALVKRVSHPGTFNANPCSGRGRVACSTWSRTRRSRRGPPQTADKIPRGMNDSFERRGIGGSAGGEVSILSIAFYNPKITALSSSGGTVAPCSSAVRISPTSRGVSAVHDDRDVDQTVTAFDQALERLQAEGSSRSWTPTPRQDDSLVVAERRRYVRSRSVRGEVNMPGAALFDDQSLASMNTIRSRPRGRTDISCETMTMVMPSSASCPNDISALRRSIPGRGEVASSKSMIFAASPNARAIATRCADRLTASDQLSICRPGRPFAETGHAAGLSLRQSTHHHGPQA